MNPQIQPLKQGTGEIWPLAKVHSSYINARICIKSGKEKDIFKNKQNLDSPFTRVIKMELQTS